MKHRKLRIAWSVVWCIAAVLLCVLWARSYRQAHVLDNPHGYKIDVRQGTLVLRERVQPPVPRPISLLPLWTEVAGAVNWYGPWPSVAVASIPLWIPVAICSVLATSPWLLQLSRLRRFSIRTLLIATTLVAATLGLIVWLR
jgi:hypothetical protein